MPSITSFSIVTVGVLLQCFLFLVVLSCIGIFFRDCRAWWTRRQHRCAQLRLLWLHGSIRKVR